MSMAAGHQPKFHTPVSTSATHGDTKKRRNQKNLIFSLDNEQYGIPLSSVKEVIGMVNVTPIPHVPSFFKGLLNLRGRIISVIDLRLKLGLEEKPYEPKKTSIIISDVNALTIGTIVDDVNEVVGFDEEQIEQNLDIANSIKRDYISGVAKASNNLVLLLDIQKVLDPDELEIVHQHAQSSLKNNNDSQEG
ncbi:chemotaxis protein CheW [Enterovibrio coralii]|uniref:Chemotaxis protein CheW n=1 Tax=Enterovibrio coralii TaxID=294935 RepID=A0A135IAG3_9GAMM|nr:chemotaxis protein CheW [Enterovibrio coralii]KXF82440.1 chemotaxis protein CheW [Enterovibrio coralii]